MFYRLFAEIVLDALNYRLSHLMGVRGLQYQDRGLVVVIIIPGVSLRTLPVQLLGAVGADVIAGSREMLFVYKSGVCLIKAALDVVAQTVAHKALSLVRDNRALAVLLDYQDVSRFAVRKARVVEGTYLLCRVEVCLAQLPDDLLASWQPVSLTMITSLCPQNAFSAIKISSLNM